jgi:WD40 repeat protein
MKRVLEGHKDSVTCLDGSAAAALLFSGSDDKTVRMWDLRSNRCCKCLLGCFEGPIEAVRLSRKSDHILYCASSDAIFSFDIRSEKVLQRDPLSIVKSCVEGEINALAINSKDEYVAFADDSNSIKIVSTSRDGVMNEHAAYAKVRTISRIHQNIVSTLSFKSNNPRELLSGGFDYMACIWDVGTGKPKTTTKFSPLNELDDGTSCFVNDNGGMAGGSNAINPPFVQCATFALQGRSCVFALGDGSVCRPIYTMASEIR